MNYQNNDWVYVEWPTNNLGNELFELATHEKTMKDTKRAVGLPSRVVRPYTVFTFGLGLLLRFLIWTYFKTGMGTGCWYQSRNYSLEMTWHKTLEVYKS